MVAAIEVLIREGYDRMTVECVASSAGVGKATIYRRWHNKVDLVVDALSWSRLDHAVIDTGSLANDLKTLIEALCSPMYQRQQLVLVGLCSAIPRHPELSEAVRIWLAEPSTALIATILIRARDRGEISSCVDLHLLATVWPSLLWHRPVTEGRPVERIDAEQLLTHILLPMLGHPPSTPRRR